MSTLETGQNTPLSSEGQEGHMAAEQGPAGRAEDVLQMGQATTAPMFVALWLYGVYIKSASDIDVAWGLGFLFLVLVPPVSLGHAVGGVQSLAMCMMFGYALRLTLHLFKRNIVDHWQEEDPRYTLLREQTTKKWQEKGFEGEKLKWAVAFEQLLFIYGFQWFAQFLFYTPTLLVLLSHPYYPVQWYHWAALGLWSVGMCFESFGDSELEKFKADPANKGKVCRKGVWNLSRHPNYFGDARVQVSLWMMSWHCSLTLLAGIPVALAIANLRYGLGAAFMEKKSGIQNRRPAYEQYMKEVPVFFPTGVFSSLAGGKNASFDLAHLKEKVPFLSGDAVKKEDTAKAS